MSYDPKAIKIGKATKTMAANILDAHERGAFIRMFVRVAENEAMGRSSRNQAGSKGNKGNNRGAPPAAE